MNIYILSENTASAGYLAEHGLSYYIHHDENILFDTGNSDVFLQNAKKLKLDIDKVEKVVLSHGHWDHGNGLRYLSQKNLICHPDAFHIRHGKSGKRNIGITKHFEYINENFDIITSIEPYFITQNIIFLGEIPRLNSFESKTTSFILDDDSDDFVMDDSGLVIKLNDEIVIISGCAHSGICNMIEYAKEVTEVSKIRAVIGGFHLKYNNKQTQKTIKYLKTQDINEIYPSHCTELPALSAFYNDFKFRQLKAGNVLEF